MQPYQTMATPNLKVGQLIWLVKHTCSIQYVNKTLILTFDDLDSFKAVIPILSEVFSYFNSCYKWNNYLALNNIYYNLTDMIFDDSFYLGQRT